jgi:hypothetical protein
VRERPNATAPRWPPFAVAALVGLVAGVALFTMGFHAPAETARILAESIDYARQAERAARTATSAR